MIPILVFMLSLYVVAFLMFVILWVVIIKYEVLYERGILSSVILLICMILATLSILVMVYYLSSLLIFGEFKIPWH